jgi:hypothetical protein
MNYVYEGKVDNHLNLHLLLAIFVFVELILTSSTFFFSLSVTYSVVVLFLFFILWLDIYLSKKKSNALINDSGCTIKQGHFFGIINIKKQYELSQEAFELLEKLNQNQEVTTFQFEKLNEEVNQRIIFINEKRLSLK